MTKRLIETAFPLAETSAASLHEKNMRHGHISTMHLWPARRPLAASRAALVAALLPDPDTDLERDQLVKRLGGTLGRKISKAKDGKEQIKSEGQGGILWWGQETGPEMTWFRDRIRSANGGKAPRVLDPFAGGGAIPFEAMRLGCEVEARDLNPVAWLLLKCTLEYPQRLGGQRRPLPNEILPNTVFMSAFLKAQGLKGSRLTAALAQVSGEEHSQPMLIEDPSRPWLSADMSWHVRAWGQLTLDHARQTLSERYPTYAEWKALKPGLNAIGRDPILLEPDASGSVSVTSLNASLGDRIKNLSEPRWIVTPTVAYLWARTVRCKSCRSSIPLLKTTWLCRKAGKRIRLTIDASSGSDGVCFGIEPDVSVEGSSTSSRKVADSRLGQGTMSSKGVWCPCCGRPGTVQMTIDDIQFEAKKGNLGTVMTAVICDGLNGKEYRLPRAAELKAAEVIRKDMESLFQEVPFGIPFEPISSVRPSPNTRGVSGLTRYGIDDWSKVYTDRQLLAMGAFSLAVRKVQNRISRKYPDEWREALTCYLALANDRIADYSTNLCTWSVSGEFLRGTFVRFVLSIAWDFAEVNPLSEVTGGYVGAINWISKALEHVCAASLTSPTPKVGNLSATETRGKFDVIITDPPYYDAIPYSDLMDFFHVWLRRTLTGLSPEYDRAFSSNTGPKWDASAKDGELVDQPGRFGADQAASRSAYEDGMSRAFKACAESLTSEGVLVIVFANKQPAAWSSLVSALIRAGFVVDASWPIRTERAARTNAVATASLSSSVWLVCRKRSVTARPGYDRQVLASMRENIKGRMRQFWDAGVRGPDFIWAATGPGLEAYSQHPIVLRESTASGSKTAMPVSDFLREVRHLVVDFAVGRVLHGDGSDATGAGLDDVTAYYLLHRQSFGLAEAPVGGAILYAMSCGLSDGDLADRLEILTRGNSVTPVSDVEDSDEDLDEAVAEEPASGSGSTVRLRAWSSRTRKALGLEGIGGKPVPLIDRVHRLMWLWKGGDVGKVDAYLDQTSVARDPLFAEVLQALIALARIDQKGDEAPLLEAISNHVQSRQGFAPARQAALI